MNRKERRAVYAAERTRTAQQRAALAEGRRLWRQATEETLAAQRAVEADPSDENRAAAHEATTRAYAFAAAVEAMVKALE